MSMKSSSGTLKWYSPSAGKTCVKRMPPRGVPPRVPSGNADGLGRRGRNGDLGHLRRGLAHREPRGAARRRQVLLHERRRDGQRAGDVAEAFDLDLGGQRLLRIDLHADQVLHRGREFGAVQALDRARGRCAGSSRRNRSTSPGRRRRHRCRPGPAGSAPAGGISRPRSLLMVFSQTSGSSPTCSRSRVSQARLPAQSSALWHFAQWVSIRWLNGLLASVFTAACACATPAERASQATGTQVPASFNAPLNPAPLLPITPALVQDLNSYDSPAPQPFNWTAASVAED